VNRVILAILGVMAALVVAVGVLVVVLVAKGGDSNSSGSGSTPGQTATDGGSSADTLRLSGSEPITLDPHIAQDASSAVYIVEIFGGLLTLDPQLALQPDLATEIPTVENGGKVTNPDGTATYTFHLRPNVTFQDRKPVTAEIVKCSLERAADPATQSLVSEFFLGDIVGVTDKVHGKASDISGVKVVDPSTIAITVQRDLPSFLYKLTYPTAFVVDPSQAGGTCGGRDYGKGDNNWTRHPNGTGPYKLDQWRLGEEIRLVANDHYQLGVAHVKNVRVLLTGGGITQYESGDIDLTGVGLDDIERVQDPADPLNKDYHSGTQLSIDYLGFNTKSPPFDDSKVRQAFAMAVDKDQIAKAVFHDAIPVANSIVMPGMPSYSTDIKGPAFDVTRAKELLKESKYGSASKLPAITLAESGTGATAGVGTSAIVEMWRKNLGVTVQIQQAESATFFQDVADGRYQAFTLGWIMDYPDEEDLLNIHFDSKSPNNDTFYKNSQVDDLLHGALAEPDKAARVQLYQEAEQIILNDVPWMPLFFSRYHVLIKPYVENYQIAGAVVPRLRYITLAPH
jgi:ABC-type transport system substrate-binding protein